MAVGKRSKPRTLGVRVAELEARLAVLERELAALRPAPKKTSAPEPERSGIRCPGCSLPVQSIARGTCPWCGFVFDAVRAPKRRR